MSTVRTMFETGTGTRDPRRTVDKYYGKYPGLVYDNTPPDSEAHRGELVVDVPGILEETPDGSGQRPIQVVARPCFPSGFFFIPEAGAQVWVEFVAGDINFPIWTGAWYPEGAVPQTADGEGPTEFQKVIRTASGQVIQLDDSDGAEKIVITDETNGNTITMNADGVTIEDANNVVTMDSNGVKLEDGNGNAITLDSSGVKLEAANSAITLDTNGIKLEVARSGITVGDTGVKITDGTGQPKFVVLEPLIDWLQSHQHVGNMGAPTPLFPANMALLITQQQTGIVKSGMGS